MNGIFLEIFFSIFQFLLFFKELANFVKFVVFGYLEFTFFILSIFLSLFHHLKCEAAREMWTDLSSA